MTHLWKPRIPATLGLSPDVILRAHQRWQSGKLDEEISRDFAVFQINRSQPFFAPDLGPVIDLLNGWRIAPSEISLLRELPSLRRLEDTFWTALAAVRFRDSVQSIRAGELLAAAPLTVSPAAREELGDLADDPPMPILRFRGQAVVVELLSEAIVAYFDHAIHRARRVLQNSRFTKSPLYFRNERELHPLLGYISSVAEFIGGASHPLSEGNPPLLLWVGQREDLRSQLTGFAAEIHRKTGVEATLMGLR